MRQTLQRQCELFIQNRDVVKSVFRWESAYVIPVCATCFGKDEADEARLRDTADQLKVETGVFSDFRGLSRPILASMIAADADPVARLKGSFEVYEAMKGRFSRSNYLPMAAVLLAGLADRSAHETMIVRAREVYDCMKRDHRFLTSSEDCVFAVLLALSPMAPEQAEQEADACYERLRAEFSRGNALQSLSHVLAMYEESAQAKCEKTMDLFRQLRQRDMKYGTGPELPVLGALAMLDRDCGVLIEELRDVDDFLCGQKGYGAFGPGRGMRRMHAALILLSEAMPRGGINPGEAAGCVAGIYAAIQAAAAAASSAAIAGSV